MRRPQPNEVPGILCELASVARELAEVVAGQPPRLSAKAAARCGFAAMQATEVLAAVLERTRRGVGDESGGADASPEVTETPLGEEQ